MDFGKLIDITTVDFSFPENDPSTISLLSASGRKTPTEVYVGCPVWGDEAYIGKIYPPKTRPAQFLHYYSRQFNTIELNSTFYNIPTEQTVKRWKDTVPEDFRFCPKLPGEISHNRSLHQVQDVVEVFARHMRHFGHRLGTGFLQLPATFAPHRSGRLEDFVKYFPADIPLAIEFRDPEFFRSQAAREAVFGVLEEHRIGTVITDVAGRRDVLHQRLTTPRATIRFVGNNVDPIDLDRLEAWADRIRSWMDLGIEQVFFFVHGPEVVASVYLADYFIEQLNRVTSLDLKRPVISDDVPQQQSLF